MANITPRYIKQFKRTFETLDDLHGMIGEEVPITGNEANPTYTANLDGHPEMEGIVPNGILVNLVDSNDTEIGEFDPAKRFTFIRVAEPQSGVTRHWKFEGLLDADDAREWVRHKYQFDQIEAAINYKNQQLSKMVAEHNGNGDGDNA